MDNTRFRYWITIQIPAEFIPIIRTMLTTPIQPFEGLPSGYLIKLPQCPGVAAYSVILIVPPKLGHKYRPPVLGLVSIPHGFQPPTHLLAFLMKFLPARLPAYNKLPPSTPVTVMRETNKVESIGPASLPLGILSLISAKTDHSASLRCCRREIGMVSPFL